MATRGHQAAAISDSKIEELEKDALACSGINPAGDAGLWLYPQHMVS